MASKGIFVGLSTIDLVYSVDRFPAPNAKVAARSQEIFVGGPAANAAAAFRHLGGETTLVTAVGRHKLADLIREEMQERSIRLVDLTPDFDQPPAISSVTVTPNGERNVVSANAAPVESLPPQIDEEVLQDASILLADGHFMSACLAWAKAARARGIKVVLDGGSWKSGSAELLQCVDTAILSADFRPPGCTTPIEILAFVSGQGVPNIAITNGPDPIRYATGVEQGVIAVPQVAVADTMGAGDVLHGAFCHFASAGFAFRQALEKAGRIASESCRYRGTRGWMRNASPEAC